MSEPTTIELPPELKARLDAEGVKDNASLERALEADPALQRDFMAAVQAAMERLAKARIGPIVDGLVALSSDEALGEFWSQVPLVLEDPFLSAADARAAQTEQEGRPEVASRLRGRIATLRQLQQQQRAMAAAPPSVRTLVAFTRVPDEEAARRLFAEHRELLQPFEVQQLLDDWLQQASGEQAERFRVRSVLLRKLRDAAPQPLPGAMEPAASGARLTNVGGDLVQAGGSVYVNSAHVQGSGTALVVNNIHIQRGWTPPRPPQLQRDVVPREAALADVSRLLAERGQVAVSGRTTATAVQGMPGIGKTTLVNHLAIRLEREGAYPDGILWEHIGPEVQSPGQVQPILNRWALYALVVSPEIGATLQFDGGAVRALLGEHPRLLVVLDNVWSLAAVKPLREALPPGAHLLVTTRSKEILFDLGGEKYELGVLTPEEARQLVVLRLGTGVAVSEAEGWSDELAKGVGHHALALDVALGLMLREGEGVEQWKEAAARIVRHVKAGCGFEGLHLAEEDREHNVELVLSYSYARMEEEARKRFRALGVFAEDGEFGTEMVAGLWECEEAQAKRQLDGYVNAALLERARSGRWKQHGVLRGYALALLMREGEHEVAASRHARLYDKAMETADNAQRYVTMRPDVGQLRHAFAWAVKNDLQRALSLVGNCANMQAGFGMRADSLAWSEATLAEAKRRGRPEDVARAHGALGNAFQRVATLPGEDRRERLKQALEAYEEALRFRTPSTAPLDFATTQNNRAALLSEMATLPGEDRRARLIEALRAGWTAFSLFHVHQHQQYKEIAARVLRDVRIACGADFDALWQQIAASRPPEWLKAMPEPHGQLALPPELKTRLDAAGVTDDASLERAFEADQALKRDFITFIEANSELLAKARIAALVDGFMGLPGDEALGEFWSQVPLALEEAFLAAAEARAAQIAQEGDPALAATLRERLAALQQTRAAQQAISSSPEAQRFSRSLEHHFELCRTASEEPSIENWRAAVSAGEILLGAEFAALEHVNLEELHVHLASVCGLLGQAYAEQDDSEGLLRAADRAIALQPDAAQWRHMRIPALIALDRLDEADAEYARVRAIAPDAPVLAELDEMLTAARAAATAATEDPPENP